MHRDVAAHGDGVTPSREDLLVLQPLDPICRVDLDRRVRIAAAESKTLRECRRANPERATRRDSRPGATRGMGAPRAWSGTRQELGFPMPGKKTSFALPANVMTFPRSTR